MSFRQNTKKSGLEEAIELLLQELKGFRADEPEYAKIVEQLTKLYALKAIDKPDRVSKDTLATIFGNVGIAVIIVMYEQKGIITSKVSHFLMRIG